MDYNKFLQQFKHLLEQTTRYTPPNVQGDRGDYQGNHDRYVDFPYVDDPKGFVTHKPLEQEEPLGFGEQSADGRIIRMPSSMKPKVASEQAAPPEEDMPNPEEAGAEAGAEVGADMGADMGAEAGGDMGGMGGDMGGDMTGMGGMGGQEEEKLTSSQIGRVYELKKIYSRLASIESYLSRATDESILELRKYVAQSIDLFEVVMSNYEQYKGNVDEIIVNFYEFLDTVYESIKKYYKSISD